MHSIVHHTVVTPATCGDFGFLLRLLLTRWLSLDTTCCSLGSGLHIDKVEGNDADGSCKAA